MAAFCARLFFGQLSLYCAFEEWKYFNGCKWDYYWWAYVQYGIIYNVSYDNKILEYNMVIEKIVWID